MPLDSPARSGDSCSTSERGFSLIETLVAVLVGVSLVVSIGVLAQSLIRHRVDTDSNSAAISLAQLQLEYLKTLPKDDSRLEPGLHPAGFVFETGETADAAPYQWQWEVWDDVPMVGSKRVVVSVSHRNNERIGARLETYLRVVNGIGSGPAGESARNRGGRE